VVDDLKNQQYSAAEVVKKAKAQESPAALYHIHPPAGRGAQVQVHCAENHE